MGNPICFLFLFSLSLHSSVAQSFRANSRHPSNIFPPPHELTRRFGPFEKPAFYSQGQQSHHQPLAKRKLLMPIISEGYASTNFQGGTTDSKPKNSKPDSTYLQVARVEEITTKTTTTTSTTTTRRPITTTTRTTRPPKIETFASQTLPSQLPDSVINGYLTDPDPNEYYLQLSSPDHDSGYPYNIPSEAPQQAVAYARPVPRQPGTHYFTTTKAPSTTRSSPSNTGSLLPSFSVPINKGQVSKVPLEGASFHVQVNSKLHTTNKQQPPSDRQGNPSVILDPKTGAPIELYTGELITADNNPGGEELVHFSFSNPSQNVESPSEEQPTKTYQVDPSQDIYQAGYQQIDVPDHKYSNNPSLETPDRTDPNQYHEDRPSIVLPSRQQDVNDGTFYPLGRPPVPETRKPPKKSQPPPRYPPQRLKRPPRIPPASQITKRKKRPERPSSSFFDFLFPSFGRNNANAERKRQPPPPPAPPSAQPKLQRVPPPPAHLLNRFPSPTELGGALNPIRLHIPGPGFGGSPQIFPNQQRPKQPRLESSPSATGDVFIVDRLGEEYDVEPEHTASSAKVIEMPADLKADESSIAVTLTTKLDSMGSKKTPEKEPLPSTNLQLPFVKYNLPKVPPTTPSIKPNLRPAQGYYSTNYYTPPSSNVAKFEKHSNSIDKQKLRDPAYQESITKAHIYHDNEIREADVSVDSIDGSFYIQDMNPFLFAQQREKSSVDEVRNVQVPEQSNEKVGEESMSSIPPLHQYAPPSRPVDDDSLELSKPDVDLVFRHSPVTDGHEIESKETLKESSIEEKKVSEEDETVADQISSLLEHYLSMPQDEKNTGVPNLYMSDDGIILEYVSPDGEQKTVIPIVPNFQAMNDVNDNFPVYSAPALDLQEEFEMDLPYQFEKDTSVIEPAQAKDYSNVKHPHIQRLMDSKELILPQGLDETAMDVLESRLQQMFVPSSVPDDSEWFILDQDGRRVMKNRGTSSSLSKSQGSSNHRSTDTTIIKKKTLNLSSSESEGGFFPSKGPEQ